MVHAQISGDALDPARELAAFIASLAGEGAVVSFVGLARPTDRTGASVTALLLDHYPGFTDASVRRIAEEAARRFEGTAIHVVHRHGRVAAGEPIVFAAAAAAHRRIAFEAADYLMDRLKTDAAFWKREDGAAGSSWIEPSPQDRADRARWEPQ